MQNISTLADTQLNTLTDTQVDTQADTTITKENKSKTKETHNSNVNVDSLFNNYFFEEFYLAHPEPSHYEKSLTYWHKNNLDEQSLEIKKGLRKWIVSEKWQRGIVHSPYTFLKDKMWTGNPKLSNKFEKFFAEEGLTTELHQQLFFEIGGTMESYFKAINDVNEGSTEPFTVKAA